MNTLWIAIVVLTALALLFVVVPLWRFRGEDRGEDLAIRKQKNIEIFEQRIAELESDLANEQISPEEFEKLKHEWQRTFLREMDAYENEEKRRAVQHHNKFLPLALSLAVLAGGIVLYQYWGAAPDLALPQLLDQVRNATDQESQEQALEELALALHERFERKPEDVQNGYMLGTLYMQTERFEEAEAVFRQLLDAVEQDQDRASILGQLAQAQYLSSEQQITPQVQATMDQALQLNPNEYAVMSLLAINAFLREDFAAALGFWRRQLSQITPGSQEARALQERMARVQALVPEEELPAEQQVAADAGASIEVHVALDESIRDEVREDMRVFIFARSPEAPAPVAAKSFAVRDLPVTVTLDDAAAMAPMFTLSSVEKVYVGARISRSGEATAQVGDFESISDTFEVAQREEPVSLVIRDQVE